MGGKRSPGGISAPPAAGDPKERRPPSPHGDRGFQRLVAGVLYEARQTERMREPGVLELVFEAQGNALVPARSVRE